MEKHVTISALTEGANTEQTFNVPVTGLGIYFLERKTETGKKILEK